MPLSSTTTLRTIAVFEALKGVVVILAGLGLLTLLHRDLEFFAEELVEILKLQVDGHFAHSIFDAARRLGGLHPVVVVTAALLYAVIRSVEAYGLWNARAWAEWFAAASGAVYIPFEVHHVAHAANPALTVAALAVNAFIVGVMVYALWARMRTTRTGTPLLH